MGSSQAERKERHQDVINTSSGQSEWGGEEAFNWPARKSSVIQHTRNGQRRDATRTGELDSVDATSVRCSGVNGQCAFSPTALSEPCAYET